MESTTETSETTRFRLQFEFECNTRRTDDIGIDADYLAKMCILALALAGIKCPVYRANVIDETKPQMIF